MIRPSKALFAPDVRGVVSSRSTAYSYRWYILEEGEIVSDRRKRQVLWAKDSGRLYFVCPHCYEINRAEPAVEGTAFSSPMYVTEGRDLDTFACEVCRACGSHMWLTFKNAAERKVWGALKMNQRKCPKCRKEVSPGYEADHDFFTANVSSVLMAKCCGIRWRVKA